MAEEIPQEELDQAKQINEGAVLELINLWVAQYKPEDTVDPSSDGVPTGKAVAAALQSIMPKLTPITVQDNSRSTAYTLNRGTTIDVSKYVKTSGSYTYLDVMFMPLDSYKLLGDSDNVGYQKQGYIDCDFDGKPFKLIAQATTSSTLTRVVRGWIEGGYLQPLDMAHYAKLNYTYHHANVGDRAAFTNIYRTAMLYRDYEDGKYYLYLSGTMRSYISGSDEGSLNVVVNMNVTPTEDECQKCVLERVLIC